MVKLYKTLVRPIVEYNNVIWGPSYTLDNQKLERMQRKATRMIPSINHLSYYDRLRHLNIPSLQHRRRRGDLIYLYQILKGSYAGADPGGGGALGAEAPPPSYLGFT